MKRIATFLALTTYLVAAVACSGVGISVTGEKPQKVYTLTASSGGGGPVTRTSMDGENWDLYWNKGTDHLNVWHAPAGEDTFVKDGIFSSEGEGVAASADFSGVLSGELVPEANYDWLFLYPWNDAVLDPASCVLTLGERTQEQAGPDNNAHMAGPDSPLYATSRAYPGFPTSLTMSNLCAGIRVRLTNSGGSPLDVQTLVLTAPTDRFISGRFSVNLTAGQPVASPVQGESYSQISLNVTGSGTVAPGAQAYFYMTCAPFSVASGESITLNVNGFERVITLTKDAAFQPGHVKTINFDYAPEPEPEPAFVQVTRTLPDFCGDGKYLLVYMSDETHGVALKTNGTYTDAGTATKAVTIADGRIAYDDNLASACKLTIQAHKADPGTDMGPIFDQGGHYTLCLQNGNGLGIWGRTGDSGTTIQFNNNANKGRFSAMIDYRDGGMQIHMANKNGNECYIRYDNNAGKFVIGQLSLLDANSKYRPVQLFRLNDGQPEPPAPDTWMKRLDGNTPLTRLSIPGAHNAATSTATSLGKTQALSVSELWDAGVRAFDLRPAYVDEVLMIKHGIVATGNKFTDMIEILLAKLDANPADFAIVIMRHESEGDSGPTGWGPAMSKYLATIANRIVPYRGDLTVDNLRGRLLVLSRDDYKDGPIGGYVRNIIDKTADLTEQQSAWINGPLYKKQALWCQDYYAPSSKSDKWAEIKDMFDATAAATAPYPLVMNNTSGYIGALIPNYVQNAVNVNGDAATYIATLSGPTGIVMMDFAGVDSYSGSNVSGAKLVDAIINHNGN